MANHQRMNFRIGIDIVDVDDFRKRTKRTPSMLQRLFTKEEITSCKKDIIRLASRFAAKEAFFKASGLTQVPWHGIQIRKTSVGKPYLLLESKIQNKLDVAGIELSLSHTKKAAVAVVVVYG